MREDETVVTREVSDTDNMAAERQTVRRSTSVSGSVVAKRIVWLLIGVIVTFLALRVILLLLAANQGAPFVDFVYAVGGMFAAPFFGIFSYTPVYGESVLELSSLVAIIVYVLIGWGLAKLFTLTRPRNEL